MRSYITIVTLALLSVVVFTDAASAQLFRRVWKRRKAEIRAGLSYQLGTQVNGQVELATEELNAELDAKLVD